MKEPDAGPAAPALAETPVAVSSSPIRRVWQPFHFLWQWTRSRHLPALLLGLPALLAAGLIVFSDAAIETPHPVDSRLLTEYARAGDRSLNDGHLETARRWYARLLQLHDSDPRARFGLACVTAEEGARDAARQQMQQLAPADGEGHGPAHNWLAHEIMRDGKEGLTREQAATLEHHLRTTLKSRSHNPWAQELLGNLYLEREQYDQAAYHLRFAAEHRPELLLKLVQVHLSRGDNTTAIRVARRAQVQYTEQLTQTGGTQTRLLLAATEALLGHYDVAEQILIYGIRQSNDPRLRLALVRFYLKQFDVLYQQPNGQLAELVNLLERAMRHDPVSVEVAGRLAMLAALDVEESEKAESLLQEIVAAGIAPAASHTILGNLAASRHQFEDAVLHLEVAHRLKPQVPVLQNNLAWCLAHLEPPQLDRALQLSNAAIRAPTSQPDFRVTRGLILTKLGKHTEALTELERALELKSNHVELHAILAQSYQQLGMEELASAHKRKFDERQKWKR